jgi:hypothetical protein
MAMTRAHPAQGKARRARAGRTLKSTPATGRLREHRRAQWNCFRRDTTMTKTIVLAALAIAFATAVEVGPELAMAVHPY